MEDGQNKKVIEQYVLMPSVFQRLKSYNWRNVSTSVSGEFDVKAISPAAYGEIFFSDIDADDKWFKARLAFITLDEKTEKEKRSSVTYLVQAHSVSGAVKHVEEVMSSTMIDYEIVGIAETKIMDVFEHRAGKKNDKDEKPEYEK